MKKFLLFLLFLIIIGSIGFFFGWTQFNVPIGSYGVMRSKTHGIDPEVIREGEFRWVWYKLIPTNVEIKVFTPALVSRETRLTGSLTSGNVYAAAAGVNTDFSWVFYTDYSFSIRPDNLPLLSSAEILNSQEDLEALEQDYALRLESFIQRHVYSLLVNDSAIQTLFITGNLPEIAGEIQTAFPELEHISCNFRVVQYPDIQLYNNLKELYEEFLAAQRRILESDLTLRAEYHVNSRLRFGELEKYGELLSRFPVLLEFFTMDNELILRLLSGD